MHHIRIHLLINRMILQIIHSVMPFVYWLFDLAAGEDGWRALGGDVFFVLEGFDTLTRIRRLNHIQGQIPCVGGLLISFMDVYLRSASVADGINFGSAICHVNIGFSPILSWIAACGFQPTHDPGEAVARAKHLPMLPQHAQPGRIADSLVRFRVFFLHSYTTTAAVGIARVASVVDVGVEVDFDVFEFGAIHMMPRYRRSMPPRNRIARHPWYHRLRGRLQWSLLRKRRRRGIGSIAHGQFTGWWTGPSARTLVILE